VLIAFDRDEAGERGAAKVAERLLAEGIDCFRIQFPKGLDANAYALKVTPPEKSLGLVIRKAVWLGKGRKTEDGGPIEPVAPEAAPAGHSGGHALEMPVFIASQADRPETPVLLALPASPMPASAAVDPPCEIRDNEITLTLGEGNDARRYRVRGLAKNLSVDLLKINLLASRGEGTQMRFYVDTLDLYSAKQRHGYLTPAALELQVSETVLKATSGGCC